MIDIEEIRSKQIVRINVVRAMSSVKVINIKDYFKSNPENKGE